MFFSSNFKSQRNKISEKKTNKKLNEKKNYQLRFEPRTSESLVRSRLYVYIESIFFLHKTKYPVSPTSLSYRSTHNIHSVDSFIDVFLCVENRAINSKYTEVSFQFRP